MTITRKSILGPGTRLRIGAAVLDAARAADTKAVKARLAAFSEVHGKYVEAQQKVDEAKTRWDAEKRRVARLDAEQDEAVEEIVRCLITDRQPRGNAFEKFSSHTPSGIKSMHPPDAVRAVRQRVENVGGSKGLSPATLEAARTAEQAAQALEAALAPLQARRDELRSARRVRDTIGRDWDTAIATLRLSARATADVAPDLYVKLFATTTPRKSKAAPSPEPAPAAGPPEPTPPTA